MLTIILTILLYFGILLLFSKFTSHRANNETFFRANRRSPWYMVAFGMVGASISGVTFVSVPGMVLHMDMTYLQMCLGFIVGYFVVALVLLPVYYRLNLTTIYSYLHHRLGARSYRTGAAFFLLSKTIGAAVRFYVMCLILQIYVFRPLGIPLVVTVLLMVLLIWLYTFKGGIKTLVWTDTFQTFCMFAALLLIMGHVIAALGLDVAGAIRLVADDARSRIFVMDDWQSKQFFWKQFLSGVFVVVVMTGLDQDMMQKNLTCKTLREAQKDMCTYGFAFVPANLLFLSLGILLAHLAAQQGLALPVMGDELLPMFAASGRLGSTVVVLFTIGIVAASFSSADSAMTALTTSWCVDIIHRPITERLRRCVHLGVAVLFVVCILFFAAVNSTSVIDAIYTICGYTYGPLLGLFAFGLFTHRGVKDKAVPYIATASPLICFAIDMYTRTYSGYRMGYELLMLNGLLTFVGLIFLARPAKL